jgi:proline racemase
MARKKREFSVIDTHTAGEPTRILTRYPKVTGSSIFEIKRKLQTEHDWLRRFLLQEPRGHRDMFGAVLLPPKTRGCDVGVVFMDNGGYLDMCGHGIIGAVTCAIETHLIKAKKEILLDTPAGVVKARATTRKGKVKSVTFENVPAFKLKSTQVQLGGKTVPVDVAFGGNFFAHLYAAEVGLEIEPRNASRFSELGIRTRESVNQQGRLVHPDKPGIDRVELVEFSGPPKGEGANARNVVVFGQGQIDRSPCGTGTCAKMALLHSEGKLRIGEKFVHESILGTRFTGRLLGTTRVGEYDAVLPEITGSATIVGFNRLVLDEKDPFEDGFSL